MLLTPTTSTAAKQPIWIPPESRVRASAMVRFMEFVNARHATHFSTYPELYQWSVTNIPSFWAALWDFTGVIASRPFDEVIYDATRMPGANWFPGARLNFAENLLRYRDDRTAIISQGEGREVERLSYAELYRRVARLAQALKRAGVAPGDRVAAFMPNIPETVVAMLASVSLGATWSSCSPDFGIHGVLERFGQIEPKVLFAADGYLYGGKRFDSLEKLAGIVEKIPSLQQVVLVPFLDCKPNVEAVPRATLLAEFESSASGKGPRKQVSGTPSASPAKPPPASASFLQEACTPKPVDEGKDQGEDEDEIDFVQLPANHPLYIMYSSGTTGAPKCMVQGAAGILMQHLKEHVLHTDLKRDDRMLYLTTCGWMMWNWLVSGLASGATIVLYDGHPFHPDPGALWRLAESERITIFGTSARYLATLEASGTRPGKECDLSALRTILSTGSPLSTDGFRFVYRDIKSDLQLASISGGTDLNGCFALGDPTSPVYPGELQCRGLGMKVAVYNQAGEPVVGEPGELVCGAPFPSMPLYFWGDEDGSKYRKAYFEKFPGVWAHGDWCTLTETGGLIIHGRSDATLNPGGVRIGSAEIYREVDTFPEIADSLAVGQRWQGDERVILFLRMAAGVAFSDALADRIKKRIARNVSPRHVPAKIIPIADIPYTINMKKVELAVRSVIHGEEVANRDALANPQSLDLYRNLPQLRD
ncbi:MAG TPA: acetoacetate--CoA ligase [Geomonas sp.]|nr:acetoacetate--CoA ligase [Geomonas sp.]